MNLDIVRKAIRKELLRLIKVAGFRTRHKKRKGGGSELRPLYRKYHTVFTLTSVRPHEHIAANIKMEEDSVCMRYDPDFQTNSASVTPQWGKTHRFYYDDPKVFDKFLTEMQRLYKSFAAKDPHAHVR